MTLAGHITKVIDLFYIPPVKKFIPRQTFRYGMCGGLTVALDTLFYFLIIHYVVCERFIDVGFVVISPHIASLILVFPITTFNGFWLNRNVAFRRSPIPQGRQLVRYLISVSGSILITYLSMKLLVEVCHIWATPSKIITTCITIVYSYIAQKHFTFRGCEEE